MGVKFQMIIDIIKNEHVRVKDVASHDNFADVWTKSLGRILFEKFREHLGLVSSATRTSWKAMLQYLMTRVLVMQHVSVFGVVCVCVCVL